MKKFLLAFGIFFFVMAITGAIVREPTLEERGEKLEKFYDETKAQREYEINMAILDLKRSVANSCNPPADISDVVIDSNGDVSVEC